jgi:penicillin-binding protein 1A
MRIEKMLSKDEILELYLNKSFFGNRAYGIAAAAEFYYGKPVKELSLLETATLVSSLKFPSSGNPISNPERNRQRSMYVVDRMLEDGYITPAQAQQARAEPPHAAPHEPPVEFDAPYVAEMVRQEMLSRYGEDVFNRGYHVHHDRCRCPGRCRPRDHRRLVGLRPSSRLAWRGATRGNPRRCGDHRTGPPSGRHSRTGRAAAGHRCRHGIRWQRPCRARQRVRNHAQTARCGLAEQIAGGASGTRRHHSGQAGEAGRFVLDQVPRAQAALVSIDADTGALRALVGGYSYAGNKFNRATQARRQPGSSFKPFVYAAAFDKGFNPASIVLDAPVMFRDRVGHTWQPQNDDGEFRGPMRLREALVQSRNLVSVRLLDSIGVDYARKYISSHFGFTEADLPPNLSMSLGAASLTPLSMARGAVFANGGSLVTPWFIDTVKDRDGKVLFKEVPATACRLRQRQQQCRCHRIGQRRGRRLQLRCSGCAIGHRASQARDRGETERDAGNPQAPAARRASRGGPAHDVPTGIDDARRRPARHRHRSQGAGTRRHRRQDRLHQQPSRRGSPVSAAPTRRRYGWGATTSVRWATANTAARPRCRSGSTTCEWP